MITQEEIDDLRKKFPVVKVGKGLSRREIERIETAAALHLVLDEVENYMLNERIDLKIANKERAKARWGYWCHRNDMKTEKGGYPFYEFKLASDDSYDQMVLSTHEYGDVLKRSSYHFPKDLLWSEGGDGGESWVCIFDDETRDKIAAGYNMVREARGYE